MKYWGGTLVHLDRVTSLKLFLRTVLPAISHQKTGVLFIWSRQIMTAKQIDINQVDDDVIRETISLDNLWAKEMIEKLSQEIFWKSMQEVYLEGILMEVRDLMALEKKTPNDRDKLLKYLQAIDNVCGFSKDKRDLVITTQLSPMDTIYKDLKD